MVLDHCWIPFNHSGYESCQRGLNIGQDPGFPADPSGTDLDIATYEEVLDGTEKSLMYIMNRLVPKCAKMFQCW